ncbi:hypothetical protein [Pseudonocardia spinosispora]|uniref:hypothetical protein n=1 Tax=Pseudonocardia spinosispora TaxID=103441 RepID=UPI00041F732A|nr:hypothetical protein [Pseudonocardia spinosispora]
MADQPHLENCPGCVADELTEQDREYLRGTGWVHPQHVLVPPPAMPPLSPVTSHPLTIAFIPFIGVGLLGFDPVRWWWVGVTVIWVAAFTAQYLRHRARHRTRRPQSCLWCRYTGRRHAVQAWTHYNALTAQEQARWHAANYERLQEQERRHQLPE